MPTPAQRRKVKNPTRKVTKKTANARHKKRTKPVGMPLSEHILEHHWSTKASVRENYAKLGLMLNLNGSAGGQKDQLKNHITICADDIRQNWTVLDGGYCAGGKAADLNGLKKSPFVVQDVIEEAVVERDQDGNIVGYKIISSLSSSSASVKGEVAEDGNTEVVKMLEEHAKTLCDQKIGWHQAPGEADFAQKCIEKYGDDYTKMARDLKLNSLQLTKNQIRKKIERYLSDTSK